MIVISKKDFYKQWAPVVYLRIYLQLITFTAVLWDRLSKKYCQLQISQKWRQSISEMVAGY